MQSHEILRQAIDRIGVKAVAGNLRSPPRWSTSGGQAHDPDDPDSSGARNPLDRLLEIVRCTGDTGVLHWLCQQADGFWVANPHVSPDPSGAELLVNTHHVVDEFSHLLATVTASIENDASSTRRGWTHPRRLGDAQSAAEQFAVACEAGAYQAPPPT